MKLYTSLIILLFLITYPIGSEINTSIYKFYFDSPILEDHITGIMEIQKIKDLAKGNSDINNLLLGELNKSSLINKIGNQNEQSINNLKKEAITCLGFTGSHNIVKNLIETKS